MKIFSVLKILKSVYEKKGLHFLIQELWKRLMPLRWIQSQDVMDMHYEDKAYRYLEKKYLPLLNNFSGKYKEEKSITRVIWVCWWQGENQAPDIVKRCILSIRNNKGSYDVVIITKENVLDYIEIPSYIKEKFEKKRMQFAHFSDYIRLALLEKYGGIWIDATVLMTDEIPEHLSSLSLFCFKRSYLSSSKTLASNWFIIAKKRNKIIQQVKYLLEMYWKQENNLCDYYLFHLLFALVVKHEENSLDWKNLPYYSNVDAHTLQFELFDEFKEYRFKELCERSFIHKLTYKFKDNCVTKSNYSNYDYILSPQNGV